MTEGTRCDGAYPLAKDLIWVESIKIMWDGVAKAINDRYALTSACTRLTAPTGGAYR